MPDFDGRTYTKELDHARLSGQLLRVFDVMKSGLWFTLEEIAARTGDAHDASISARLRDFRKAKFGGFVIDRRRRGAGERGLFEYRLRRKVAESLFDVETK